MGTFSRLSASRNFIDNVFPELLSLPSTPPPAPTNDLPCNATPLSVSSTCSLAPYNNIDATDSWVTDNTIPVPSCGSYSGSDVWFTAVVPSSGEMVILTYSERTAGWLDKVNFAVYSGSCTGLTEIGCYTPTSSGLYITTAVLSGRTAGEILYIRVYDQENTIGNFQICASGPCGDIIANAGLGGESCDLNFKFSGTAPVNGTGTWSIVSGPGTASYSTSPADPVATVSVTAPGTYRFAWTVDSGTCTDADSINVIFSQPVFSAPEDDKDLCNTLSSTLTVFSASVGNPEWKKTSGPGIAHINTPNLFTSNVDVTEYGVYVFTLTVTNGTCSASDDLTIGFYEEPTEASVAGSISNCGTLTSDPLGGNTPTVGTGEWSKISGPGTVSFSNINSGSSTATVNAYGTYEYQWKISNGSCTASAVTLTVTYFDPPTADVGTGGDECDLDFSLSAVPSIGTGTWTKTGGSGNAVFSPNVNSPNATVTVDAYDAYQFTWSEISNGCSDDDTVGVNFFEQPIADAGTGGDECGLNFILSAVASSGTGTWTKTGGSGNAVFSPNVNTPNAMVTVDAYDTYQFTWSELNNSCTDSDAVSVNFYEQPVANAGSGGNECDLNFTLSASASLGIGTWTKTGGSGNAVFSPNANTPNATVTVDAYDAYQFTWTEISNGCSDDDTVGVNFFEQPVANAGSGGNECDLNFTLSATASVGTGTWTKQTGTGNLSFAPNANDPNAVVTSDTYGSFTLRWTEVNGSCSGFDDVVVNFYEQPIANAGSGGNECDLDFALSATQSVGTGTWTKQTGTGNLSFAPNVNDPNAVVTSDTYGTFTLRWTEVNGSCSGFDDVVVNFNEKPVANAGSGGNECDLDFTLSAIASLGTGTWTKTGGSGNAVFSPNVNSPNATVTVDVYDTYQFTWSELNNSCTDSDAVSVNFYEQQIADAGSDGNECGLNFTLSAVAGVGVGTWSQISGPGTTLFSNINSGTSMAIVTDYGTYIYRWTISNGTCTPLSDDVTVNFYETPTIATVGTDQDICDAKVSYALLGNTPSVGIGSWSQVSGPGTTTFSNVNSGGSTASVSEYGIYVYRWTISNGTCTSSKADVTVTYFQKPSLASVGGDQNHCSNLSSTSLGGNTPWVGIGSWSQVSGPGTTSFSDVNFGNSTATVSQYGTYTYRWTIINGSCASSEADIVVNFNEEPTAASVGSDQNYCDGLISGSLGGNTPTIGVGSWSQLSGPGTTTFNDVNAGTSNAAATDYGTYIYRWTITNGICVSSDDITVNFNQTPISYAGADDNICGGNSYTISGSNSANGPIVWSTNGNGTFDDNTIDNPTYNFGIGESGIITLTKTVENPSCSSVSDDMIITFSPEPIANAGLGGNECDLDFSLSATASVGIGTWTKTSGSGNAVFSPNANTPNAIVTVDVYDTYQFTWTEVRDGCTDSDNISVSFYEQPIANAGVGGDECDLDYDLLATQSSGTGTWTKESGPGNLSFSPDANAPDAKVTADSYGSYKLRWTEANGACSEFDEIIVNFYEQPIADAGVGGNECDLDFIFNAKPSAGSGKWTQVSGSGISSFFPNSSSSNAAVTVSDFGSYQYLWTETNGNCTDSEMIDVNFYDQPATNAGVGGNMCGLTFSLLATPSLGTGTWTKTSGNGNASFFPNPNSPNSAVTVDSYGIYSFRWTEDNGTCSASDEVVVNFYEQPIADAGFGGDQCGLEYSLAATSSAGIGVWTKISGVGNVTFTPDANSPNATVMVDAYDSYQLMWTKTNGDCTDNDVIDITFEEQPIANAGMDIKMEYSDRAQLGAVLSTAGIGEWTVVSGYANLFDQYSPNTEVDKLGIAENILRWTETNKFCSDYDDVKLTVDKLFIPTVITPNGDGKNEFFMISGSDNLENIQLTIFNRNGVEIYTDSNYKNDWNGLDRNGNELVTDTYFYVLKIETKKVFKGCIVIKR
ncbi:gliding motility-associated C-terminal domain-containing protein [Labilibaculum sp. K2S]|uniref:gliding motility-associated C-terminal domain-containing protein n=1 Tax=Labilibaculum sp. K2S TaxID=3056386 RepID=UPI0025A47A01|nr:gliding motility-associated C-terminal domain-containing protein [Labilibaculum sp. K2S]MDM8158717.1 gliding motility-associated C-terminal domain-containing protein [Labilibaculum sp. K2S]